MNLLQLYKRTADILTSPRNEWKKISGENLSVRELKRGVLIPYATVIGIFTFFGTLFTYLHSPVYSSFYLLVNAIIEFGIIYLQTVLMGWIIFRLAVKEDESNRHRSCFALVTYSNIPFFLLLSLTKLFPPLMILMVGSVYSVYLYGKGIPVMVSLPANRRKQFVLLTVILNITVFIVLSQILTLLYSALTKQFTTFGN